MSDNEINKAKDFLRRRIAAETSATNNLSRILDIYAAKVVSLCKKHNVKVENIGTTRNLVFQRALNVLLGHLMDDITNMTVILSSDDAEAHREQILAWIGTSIYGMTFASRLRKHILAWLTQIKDGGNYLKSGGGHSADVLVRNTITANRMEEYREENKDAIGFYSMRGSTYPCSICDDETGFHTMDEYPMYGTWHPNCKCIIIFEHVKKDE